MDPGLRRVDALAVVDVGAILLTVVAESLSDRLR